MTVGSSFARNTFPFMVITIKTKTKIKPYIIKKYKCITLHPTKQVMNCLLCCL